MSRPLFAGNWKMNLDRAGCVALAQAIVAQAGAAQGDLLVCPPSVYLEAVRGIVQGTSVALGAQNVWPDANGAFTGEISTSMLRDCGCTHVILGHSERRQLLGETDAAINRKLHAALAADLTPIVCVGELLAEREAGRTLDVIRTQVAGSLAGLTTEQAARLVLAYEPVWAIGTGRVATPEQAEEVHRDLRKLVAESYNAATAAGIRLLYGGSVKPGNAQELLARPNVDGFLIGGASLKAEDFLAIARAAKV